MIKNTLVALALRILRVARVEVYMHCDHPLQWMAAGCHKPILAQTGIRRRAGTDAERLEMVREQFAEYIGRRVIEEYGSQIKQRPGEQDSIIYELEVSVAPTAYIDTEVGRHGVI